MAEADDELAQQMTLAYRELREIAGRLLRGEREGHTLQKTALVHEAFIRLYESNPLAARSPRNFLALASHQMYLILVDYARRHKAGKRTGHLFRVPLLDADHGSERDEVSLLALHEAMESLGKIDARARSVVELKFIGGFTNKETAGILGISDGTVEADWQFAKTWLFRTLASQSVSAKAVD